MATDALLLPDHTRTGRDDSVFVAALGTCILSMAYDYRTRIGTIQMPDAYCTNMLGAITLFTQIDPDVRRIVTVAGSTVDTVYVRRGERWQATSEIHHPRVGPLVTLPGS